MDLHPIDRGWYHLFIQSMSELINSRGVIEETNTEVSRYARREGRQGTFCKRRLGRHICHIEIPME